MNRSFGSDLIAQVSVPPNMAAGTVLVHIPIAPLSLTSGRLGEEAALWVRWRPVKLIAKLQLAGASTTFGALMFGWTADSTPEMGGSNLAVMRRVATFKPLQTVRLNQNGTLRIPTETSRKWLQTTGDVDQTAQGDIAVIVSAQTGGYTGGVTMSLFLDWEVEFEAPTLGISTGPGDQTISPDAGWAHLFTTSDGSFDAERLTLKMHSGGSMVPFSAAQPGVVYTPSGQTRIPYYKEDSTSALVKYFAKVQGYAVPGLLCFSTYADARAYITSGDVSKALKYKAAGEESTPATPTFKPTSSVSQADDSDLSVRVDRLTLMLETLLQRDKISATSSRDLHVERSLRDMENTVRQITNPLNVHLDRGTVGTPLVTLTEDPVRRPLSRRLNDFRREFRPRSHSTEAASSFEDLS